jgi:hypothetical protein
MILAQDVFSQSGGSNMKVDESSYIAIDEKASAEVKFLQDKLELNDEQAAIVESIILKNELEKVVESSSEMNIISKVNASIAREEEKDNELKGVLTAGQYKIYKLSKYE